jgi:hypothetical protein
VDDDLSGLPLGHIVSLGHCLRVRCLKTPSRRRYDFSESNFDVEDILLVMVMERYCPRAHGYDAALFTTTLRAMLCRADRRGLPSRAPSPECLQDSGCFGRTNKDSWGLALKVKAVQTRTLEGEKRATSPVYGCRIERVRVSYPALKISSIDARLG